MSGIEVERQRLLHPEIINLRESVADSFFVEFKYLSPHVKITLDERSVVILHSQKNPGKRIFCDRTDNEAGESLAGLAAFLRPRRSA